MRLTKKGIIGHWELEVIDGKVDISELWQGGLSEAESQPGLQGCRLDQAGWMILPKEFYDDLADETTVVVIGTGEYLEMMKESDWRRREEEIMNEDWAGLLNEI